MNHVRRSSVAAVAVHADCDVLAGRNLLEIVQELAEQDILSFNRLAPPVRRLLLVNVAIHGDLSRASGFVRSCHGVDLFTDRNDLLAACFLLQSAQLRSL